MCGRYTLTRPDDIAARFGLGAHAALADEIAVEAAFAGIRADHDARQSARRRMSYAEVMDNHLVPA